MTTQLKAVFSGIIIIFITIMFIVQVTPTYESEISSANITNTTTSMLVDMSEWVIPVLALVGVILGAFAFFRTRQKG